MKASSKSPVEHALQPTLLTLIVLGLGGVFAVVFPWQLVVFYGSILPFPLFLLWVGRDAPSAGKVIAEADVARSKRVRIIYP